MTRHTLQSLGEDRLVRILTRGLPLGRKVILGAGDDCAVVSAPASTRWQLFKADVVVEGVHFTPSTRPYAVGWKAAARAVSDIAAMGGWPTHSLITVVSPARTDTAWLRAVYRGLTAVARRFDFSIAGGETSAAPEGSPIAINVSLLGEVEPKNCIRRSGARPGDVVFVTGRLGGSLASGRHFRFVPRVAEARWLVTRFRPTAMIDLSDGLAKDLPRLADRGGVGWMIDCDAIPRNRGCSLSQALGDGEDFELLFAVPARQRAALERGWRRAFPTVPLTAIGRIAERGRQDPPLQGGYEHFARPERGR